MLLVLIPVVSQAEIDQSVPMYIATMAVARGIDPQMALYVSYNESHWDCDAVGDSGRSHGCWQIFLPAHKTITKAQAHDLIWSTNWSLDRMLKDGGCKIWTTCPTRDG